MATCIDRGLNLVRVEQENIRRHVEENTQVIAAQRDIQVARALDMVRQANDNLQPGLAWDLQTVEMTNAEINQINDSALPILNSATGQELGVEPEAWKTWWSNEQGYAHESSLPEYKPTYTDFVSVPSMPPHSACFVAGTMVQTVDGPRAIESIQVGDRVLSQNATTGKSRLLCRHERALGP